MSIAKESNSIAEVIRKLGIRQTGGSHSHISRKLKEYEIDISHFTGKTSSRGRPSTRKRHWQEVLTLRNFGRREDAYRLRRALIESGIKYTCSECLSEPVWKNKELRLQVDHLNRNWLDDRRENLRFLCPNCHSQTDGYNGSRGLCDLTNDNRRQRERRKRKNGTIDQLVGVASLRN